MLANKIPSLVVMAGCAVLMYGLARLPFGQAMLLCLACLGVAAFVLYITYFQIIPEERALAQKFGAEYTDYCRRVRRWI